MSSVSGSSSSGSRQPIWLGLLLKSKPITSFPVAELAKLTPSLYAKFLSSRRIEVLVGLGYNREIFFVPGDLFRWMSPYVDKACAEADKLQREREVQVSVEVAETRAERQEGEKQSKGKVSAELVFDNGETQKETANGNTLGLFKPLEHVINGHVQKALTNGDRPTLEVKGQVMEVSTEARVEQNGVKVVNGSLSDNSAERETPAGKENGKSQLPELPELPTDGVGEAQREQPNKEIQLPKKRTGTKSKLQPEAKIFRPKLYQIHLPDQSPKAFELAMSLIIRPNHTFVPIFHRKTTLELPDLIDALLQLSRLGTKLQIPMFDRTAALNINFILKDWTGLDVLEAYHVATALELEPTTETRRVVMEAAFEIFEKLPWDSNRTLEADWKFAEVVRKYPMFCQEMMLSGKDVRLGRAIDVERFPRQRTNTKSYISEEEDIY